MRSSPSPKSAISSRSILCLLIALSMLASAPAWAQVAASMSPSPYFRPHTPLEVKNGTATPVGHYGGTMLRLTIGLQPPHVAEEQEFLRELQTPGKGSYHKFLTTTEWAERFGPSVADEQAVVDWATAQGLTVTQRFPGRELVNVEGTVATIEKALNVTINSYQLGTKTGFSNDRDAEIPSSLTGIIHSIAGLQNLHVARQMSKNATERVFPDYTPGPAISTAATASKDGDPTKLPLSMRASLKGTKNSGGASPNYTTGTPYDPQDLYSVAGYDAYALYNLGHCCNPTGVSGGTGPITSIAIATSGAQAFADMAGFQATYSYLAYSINEYGIDGQTVPCVQSPTCDGEGTMDMEWSTAMSNSFGSYQDTAHVYMYDGDNSGFGTFETIYGDMISGGVARNFSTSWGCEEITCFDESDMDTTDSLFSEMAGEGWSMTVASGDQGATAGCGDAIAVQYPASDPNVVGAGGTTHYMGGGPPPTFESFTAWGGGPDGCSTNDGGSTGGYSAWWGEPSFQTGLPSRGVPDIALNADWYNTPMWLYFDGGFQGNGGTSIVAPTTVGFFAQENAYLLSLGDICSGGTSCAPMGPPNTFFYQQGYRTFAAPHDPFYDITTGNNCNNITTFYGLGCYGAGTGWDPVTGWGEYNFLQLAWAINWIHIPGDNYPVANFSGPTTSKWYNSNQEVTWTISNTAGEDGSAGFAQQWDGDPGNPTSEATPATTCAGWPCSPYNAFYNGPQYANSLNGCLDFLGDCANSTGGAQGLHTVNVRTFGNEGESELYTYGPIGYDTIAPTTTASVSGSLSGGDYVNTATVTLTATDPGYPTTGSGVAATYYSINGGTYATYSGPVAVSVDGADTVYYYSVDNAGNTGATNSVSFKDTSSTSVTLTSSLNPAPTGHVIDFKATVGHTLAGTPTGTVTFKDGATVLGSKSVASSGIAELAISTLAVGTHSITATYNGATYFLGSASGVLTETIANPTTTTLASSVNPSAYEQPVTFTATVSPSAATGTVTFKNGAVVLGTGTLSGGKATLVVSNLTVSTAGHVITAVYGGNASYVGSTSAALKQIVNKENTTTTVTSSLNPSTSGQTVTFTATVHDTVAGTPIGIVQFLDGATLLGSKPLTSGDAAFSTSKLTVGSHSITAKYLGGVDDNGSTSAVLTQVVNQ